VSILAYDVVVAASDGSGGGSNFDTIRGENKKDAGAFDVGALRL
jgi:hypothetical protein